MALALSTGGHPGVVNPTASLAEALKSFDRILSAEQRQNYHANVGKPDPSSVIDFISKIDADNKGRAGKCVASRLCKFLEAVKQFSDVVDTFISSHPTIAALVWGGVKTAILTASNIASYFDKITSLIMTVGRSCPTYQRFGHLYPNHIELQTALCDYFAVIVRLCVKIVEVSQRSGVMQVFSPIFNPFEAEFGSYQNDLEEAVKVVSLQISAASKQVAREDAQLAQIERGENVVHRRSVFTFQSEVQKEQAENRRLQERAAVRRATKLRGAIRTILSPMDHRKAWQQAAQQRVESTADWIQKDLSFGKWKKDGETSILWCSGNLGSGKTVLVSNVVTHLHATREPSNVISYFFCRPELQRSLLARDVLGSIACQLLESYIDRADYDQLYAVYKESQDLEVEEVVSFLDSKLGHDSSHFIILDGIDECDGKELDKISKAMDAFQKSQIKGYKIFCAGRPDIEGQLFRNCRPTYRIPLARPEVTEDINRYINTTLNSRLEEQQLKLGDPALILKIMDALQKDARGMFLWARLLIDEICAQDSDRDILTALENLPTKLSDILRQKMRRILARSNAKKAIKALQNCSVAKRPLTVEELREVLTVEYGQKSLDTRNLSNDMRQVLADCCGLLFVDDEDQTVHYVHDSVRKHLFTEDSSLFSTTFEESHLDKQLGVFCLTYLNFTDFKQQLVKVKSSSKTTIDPIKFGLTSIPTQRKLVNKVAQHLIRSKNPASSITAGELERQVQKVLGVTEASRLQTEIKNRQFCFLAYARDFWIFHLRHLDDKSNPNLWRIFCKCLESTDTMASRPWTGVDERAVPKATWLNGASTEIRWIFENDHSALLRYHESLLTKTISGEVRRSLLIHSSAQGQLQFVEILLESNSDNGSFSQALQAAAGGGHLDVVERLLTAQAGVNAVDGGWGGTALQVAAGSGHLDVVERLLAAQTGVNAAGGGWGGRALQSAAKGGHIDVVERLLTAQADVNAAAGEWGGRALQAAAGGGHIDVVERLLTAQADVNAAGRPWGGRTALQAAAEGGHLDVVERLLAAQADVNAAVGFGCLTALQAAAKGGHLDVVERLLAAQADVNAVSSEGGGGRTALQAAAEGGHLDVVERLLAAQADVNAAAAEGWDGRTALQAAAEGGHLDVVERLLAAQADVNAAGFDGLTALQAAAKGGHLGVVERLLTAQADVNAAAAGWRGRTALQVAAKGGHLGVVERLLTAQADVNAAASGWGGRTALQAAAGGGHIDVVERLLTAQADVNAAGGGWVGRTALQAAEEGGHLDVVERLLTAQADVNAAGGEWVGRTALQAAEEGGPLDVVERLKNQVQDEDS